MSVTKLEQETIISFNEQERDAHIFTYNKGWQKHLEEKLGLQPTYVNGQGGKEYTIAKTRILPPRARPRAPVAAGTPEVSSLGGAPSPVQSSVSEPKR